MPKPPWTASPGISIVWPVGRVAHLHPDTPRRMAGQVQNIQVERSQCEVLAAVQQQIHRERMERLVVQEAGAGQVGVARRHGGGFGSWMAKRAGDLVAQVAERFHMIPMAVRADDQLHLAQVGHLRHVGAQGGQTAMAAAVHQDPLARRFV